jgi:hypothetical protein
MENNSNMLRKDFIIETYNDPRWKGIDDRHTFFFLQNGTKLPVQMWADDGRTTYVVLTDDGVVRFFDHSDVEYISAPRELRWSPSKQKNEAVSSLSMEEIARKWIDDERLSETSAEGEQLVMSLVNLLNSVAK